MATATMPQATMAAKTMEPASLGNGSGGNFGGNGGNGGNAVTPSS
jgi:hypothetical protein